MTAVGRMQHKPSARSEGRRDRRSAGWASVRVVLGCDQVGAGSAGIQRVNGQRVAQDGDGVEPVFDRGGRRSRG